MSRGNRPRPAGERTAEERERAREQRARRRAARSEAHEPNGLAEVSPTAAPAPVEPQASARSLENPATFVEPAERGAEAPSAQTPPPPAPAAPATAQPPAAHVVLPAPAAEAQPAPQAQAPLPPPAAPEPAAGPRGPGALRVRPRSSHSLRGRLAALAAIAAALVVIFVVLDSLLGSSRSKTVAPAVGRVVIPEGSTRLQIAQIAAGDGLAGSYRAAAKSSPLLNPAHYGAPRYTPDLEGFLFPATYDLAPRSSVGRLVDEQLAAFKENFGAEEARRARALHVTPYQLLTIASMVEREARVPGDRAKSAERAGTFRAAKRKTDEARNVAAEKELTEVITNSTVVTR